MMPLAECRPVAHFRSVVTQKPVWADDHAIVCEWYCAQNLQSAGDRKQVSHLGGHVMDSAVTEAVTRGGKKCKEYRVVYNG